jgi:hypothetical protein
VGFAGVAVTFTIPEGQSSVSGTVYQNGSYANTVNVVGVVVTPATSGHTAIATVRAGGREIMKVSATDGSTWVGTPTVVLLNPNETIEVELGGSAGDSVTVIYM